MNLAEKKALKTKYLLSGLAPNMKYSHLARFCIREASRKLPGAGKPMIEDKATKYVVEVLSLFPNRRLLNYLAHTDSPQIYTIFHEAQSVMRKNKSGFPRRFILDRIRKNTKMIMRVLVPPT